MLRTGIVTSAKRSLHVYDTIARKLVATLVSSVCQAARRVLWCLDPVLQCGHDLAAIESEQGWGIKPEARESGSFSFPVQSR